MELEDVVAELAPGLLRYAKARTRSTELAEDVAQEALVALVARWRRFGPPFASLRHRGPTRVRRLSFGRGSTR